MVGFIRQVYLGAAHRRSFRKLFYKQIFTKNCPKGGFKVRPSLTCTIDVFASKYQQLHGCDPVRLFLVFRDDISPSKYRVGVASVAEENIF